MDARASIGRRAGYRQLRVMLSAKVNGAPITACIIVDIDPGWGRLRLFAFSLLDGRTVTPPHPVCAANISIWSKSIPSPLLRLRSLKCGNLDRLRFSRQQTRGRFLLSHVQSRERPRAFSISWIVGHDFAFKARRRSQVPRLERSLSDVTKPTSRIQGRCSVRQPRSQQLKTKLGLGLIGARWRGWMVGRLDFDFSPISTSRPMPSSSQTYRYAWCADDLDCPI